jgi:hypothetical protein
MGIHLGAHPAFLPARPPTLPAPVPQRSLSLSLQPPPSHSTELPLHLMPPREAARRLDAQLGLHLAHLMEIRNHPMLLLKPGEAEEADAAAAAAAAASREAQVGAD